MQLRRGLSSKVLNLATTAVRKGTTTGGSNTPDDLEKIEEFTRSLINTGWEGRREERAKRVVSPRRKGGEERLDSGLEEDEEESPDFFLFFFFLAEDTLFPMSPSMPPPLLLPSVQTASEAT